MNNLLLLLPFSPLSSLVLGKLETLQIFLQLIYYLLFFLALKTIYNFVYNYSFTPLCKIPGPKFAKISNLPIILRRPHGKVYKWFWELHQEYGGAVRVAPNHVLFSSKEAIRKILVVDRRSLSPAFGIRYISTLEPLMNSCTKSLVEKITCTLDIIGEVAFGESFHLVEKGMHPLPMKIYLELKRRVMCHTFPYMRPFLKKDPWTYEFISNIIKERKELNAKGGKRDDLLQILIDMRDNETGNPLSELEIQDQTMEFLIGGSDTSGYTANMALIVLLNHPEKLRKLVSELDSIYPSEENDDDGEGRKQQSKPNGLLITPTHDSLKNLIYLNSVLNEVLRLFPVALAGIMRQTRQDTIIDGYLIPKDTIVSASIYQVHRAKDIWGVDADDFVPERWIFSGVDNNKNGYILEPEFGIKPKTTISDSKKSDFASPFQKGYYPFSAGTRNCIGQTFAWMELRLILASLLLNFEFELIPNQDLDISHFITPSLTTKKYEVGVKLRNRN
nr:8829_t:CDS:2 [Entrophospora candida]CAG8489119.1 3764_t:CDS:2 [Entrophospora candida]